MRRLLTLVIALTFAAPALMRAQAPSQSLSGLWDAAVVVNGLEIPFRFEIGGTGASITGSFFNGIVTTFGDNLSTTIETHVMDTSMDLYGKQVRVAFVQRLRDERKFPDLDALQEQISADVRRAARLFDRLSV